MDAWSIKSKAEWEREHRNKHGDAEYERRLRIANEKADQLNGDDNDSWAEMTFMRPQFHSVAMQLTSDQLAKAELWSGQRWAKLIYKLAGV